MEKYLEQIEIINGVTCILQTKWDKIYQSEMNIPVKYIGIGEHIDDLQKFDADAFVDALFETKG